MKSPRILIAGVTGFLGSRLARELVAKGQSSLVGFHRTNSNFERLAGITSKIELINIEQHCLESLFRRGRINIVVNCLADYGRSKLTTATVEANLDLPSRILDLAVKHGVTVFLNAGTSLPPEVSNYSLTKNQFSDRLRNHCSNLVAIDARLEHFYGAGESDERFISFLIKNFLKPADALDLTQAEQQRDFLHVDDVVSALCLLMDHGMSWQPAYYDISVGSGEAYMLRNVVERIRRLTGNQVTRINYGAVPYRENEVMLSRADIQKLKELGWNPRVDLATGLRRTIDCYWNTPQERKAS